MREVGVLEAKTHLSAIDADVERGADELITRHGRPVVRMTAVGPADATAGDELATRLEAFRERLVRENPALAEPESWADLKALARR